MVIHRLSAVVCIASVLAFAVSANAKGPVVKLVVAGPDLVEPIEITDPEAIDVDVYGATFVDREAGPIEEVPTTPVPPYVVQFYDALTPDDDVQMKYVVYYVYDWAERRARVYFPGRHDAWWRHNVFTVAHQFEGEWYYTTESWGRAVQEAIFDHNDPRELARH
jgi:hypothetical protein